jgi:hypothetical protein
MKVKGKLYIIKLSQTSKCHSVPRFVCTLTHFNLVIPVFVNAFVAIESSTQKNYAREVISAHTLLVSTRFPLLLSAMLTVTLPTTPKLC